MILVKMTELEIDMIDNLKQFQISLKAVLKSSLAIHNTIANDKCKYENVVFKQWS
jgi:hypothetical protein